MHDEVSMADVQEKKESVKSPHYEQSSSTSNQNVDTANSPKIKLTVPTASTPTTPGLTSPAEFEVKVASSTELHSKEKLKQEDCEAVLAEEVC